jgi:MoxR-like ATPase
MEEHSETLPGIIKAIMDDVSPRPVAITINELPAVTIETPHPNLERVLRKAARRDFVWLCGPRGSGKSTAARHVAKALGLKFHIMTGADDQFALIGYIQPHDGSIVRTAFREAYEHGGVLLFDEGDTFNPSAIICMNDALANGECAFPDGLVKMSPNFYAMFGTNTDGRGATGLYNGRNAIDGATRDRFAFIPWDYAPGLETQLGQLNPQWTKYVQAVRAEMINQSMDETPSPRATMKGAVAINDGDTWEEAAESYIWKGISSDIQSRIDRAVPISQFRN